MPNDPWYTVMKDQELHQGDLTSDCPVILPQVGPPLRTTRSSVGHAGAAESSVGPTYRIFQKRVDIVVMTQSCDLANQRSALVLVCPHYSLSDLFDAFKAESRGSASPTQDLFGKFRSLAQNIRGGRTVSRYMLAPCSLKSWKRGVRVVDFEQASSLPYHYLMEFAGVRGKRLRIKSPYREHIAQAFGTLFMRVALDSVVSKDAVNLEISELEGQLH